MFESGMEILRADFHLHTKADKEFKYNGEENSYINNYIDELFAQGIRVAVLTNHNKFDMEEYKALKRKAAKKDIATYTGCRNITVHKKTAAKNIRLIPG